jgi:ribonuclease Z
MNFTVMILGTASALPTTQRYPSAQIVDVRGRLFMIDCGEGAQIQLRKAKVSFLNIEHICLSHIHGDHIFGIFGLLSTMGLLARKAPLNIFAPKGFAPILEFFKTQFGEGLLFDIHFIPLEMTSPEVVYESRTTELLAFPLNHRVETFGFIIREKMPQRNVHKEAISKYDLSLTDIGTLKRGEDVVRESDCGVPLVIKNEEVTYYRYMPRSYAYCSDTAPFAELAEWVRGVDLLYHEATFPDEMAEMAEKTFHSTTIQAATVGKDAGVKKLIVGHYSSRFPSVDFYLDQIKTVFPEAMLAHDGDFIEI